MIPKLGGQIRGNFCPIGPDCRLKPWVFSFSLFHNY
jgi:hypothetical protein